MLFGVPSNLRYKKMHRLKAVYLVKKRRNSNVVLTQQLFEQKFFCPKFCEFYLKSLSAGNITSNQIEAIRRAVKRTFKKDVFLKINLSLFDHLTKKPISSRMGKGKGKPYKWVAPVKKGKVMFEFKQRTRRFLSLKYTRLLLKTLKQKLTVRSKIYRIKY